jgi:uncharacterized SAM-binding protein YcdF (DUF218 family)
MRLRFLLAQNTVLTTRGAALRALCLAFFLVGFASAPRLASTAITTFEATLKERFGRVALQDHDQIAGIVVLGGELARIQEATTLAARFPEAKVLLSGAGEEEETFASAEATLAGRLQLDRRPKNTFENAVFSRELARARPGERWILVTSAIHMPRAMGAFRAVGFNVEPWPVLGDPAPEGIRTDVLHEIAGLLTYRLLGRSQDFYPGP